LANPKITVVMDAVNKAQGKMDAVGAEGERMAGKMKAVGAALVAIGAAASAAILKAVDDVKQFNRSIEETAVTAGASAKDIDKMKEAALELGNAIVPAEEVSKGFGQLLRITQDTGDALNTMSWFVDLAMVSGRELATEIADVTDVMAQFDMGIYETNKIMDAATAIYSRSSWAISDVFNALKETGPAAATAGVSFGELSTLLGVIAEKGMSAGQATMALQVMFGKLVDDTEATRSTLEGLGVAVFDAEGAMRPMMDILRDLADQFEKMPDSTEKTAAAVELFGSRSGARMGTLLSQGSAALDIFSVKIQQASGYTAELAEVAEDSISPWQKFKNSLHEVSIKFGAVIEPVGSVLSFLTSLLVPVGMLMMMYPTLSASINLTTISMKLHAVAAVLSAKAQWLLNAAILGCPLVWVIALIVALVAALYLLIKHWDKLKDSVGKFAANAREKLNALGNWLRDKWAKAVEGTKKAWDNLKTAASKTWEAIKSSGSKLKTWFQNNAHRWFERYQKFKEIGRKLMEALKDGMEAMKNKLKDAAHKIADAIGKFFGGSLPEVGPLKHIVTMGEDLMRGYGKGMQRGSIGSEVAAAIRDSLRGGSTYNTSIGGMTMNVTGMGVLDDNQVYMIYRRLEQLEISRARRASP